MNHIETKITENIKDAQESFWQFVNAEIDPVFDSSIDLREEIEIEKYYYSRKVYDLLKLVHVYLEQKKLYSYLNRFNKEIVNKIDDKYLFDINHHPETPFSSSIIDDIRDFLCPFSIFDQISDYIYNKRFGIKYLENILNSTAYLINESNKIPQKEADVYNIVKSTLLSIFPKSINAKSSFFKTTKQYKPDILIPELETAIEYKFAKDKERLKQCIEQILIDVEGYKNDSDYKIFYAVFYVSHDIIGKPRFFEFWNSYNFPVNWKPIYVVGNAK